MNTEEVGLIALSQNFFNTSLTNRFAVVINQPARSTIFNFSFDGKEYTVCIQVIAKDGQTRAVCDAAHAAHALVVIDYGDIVSGGFADSPVRTIEGTRIAGKAIKAICHYEGCPLPTLRRWKNGLLKHTDGALLRVNIITRNIQVVLVVHTDFHSLCHLVGRLPPT